MQFWKTSAAESDARKSDSPEIQAVLSAHPQAAPQLDRNALDRANALADSAPETAPQIAEALETTLARIDAEIDAPTDAPHSFPANFAGANEAFGSTIDKLSSTPTPEKFVRAVAELVDGMGDGDADRFAQKVRKSDAPGEFLEEAKERMFRYEAMGGARHSLLNTEMYRTYMAGYQSSGETVSAAPTPESFVEAVAELVDGMGDGDADEFAQKVRKSDNPGEFLEEAKERMFRYEAMGGARHSLLNTEMYRTYMAEYQSSGETVSESAQPMTITGLGYGDQTLELTADQVATIKSNWENRDGDPKVDRDWLNLLNGTGININTLGTGHHDFPGTNARDNTKEIVGQVTGELVFV